MPRSCGKLPAILAAARRAASAVTPAKTGQAIVPGIGKWLPTGAAIGLTNAPGPSPSHSLSAAVAGVVLAGTVLAGYGIVMLLAASRTTIRRDVA
jgi:hypothetical protein